MCQVKPIPTYPDYTISTDGIVTNVKKDRQIKPYNSNTVELFNSEGSSTWTIHVLLACTFLGLDITDPFRNRVLFKDGNTHNISLDNLYVEDTSDLPGEVWKPVKDYSGNVLEPHFEISNKGRLKTTKHIVHTTFKGKPVERHQPEMILITPISTSGYLSTVLNSIEGKKVNFMVHRSVAVAFCPNDDPQHKTFVNHIDGNKLNNCAENLEWCTPKENTAHAIATGLIKDNPDQFKSKAILHVESGTVYNSLSDASRAMGRAPGYVGENLHKGTTCKDKQGNIWTFKPVESSDDYKPHLISCTIDELPGQTFKSLSEASIAIGRPKDYISNQLGRNERIKDMQGNELHVHTTKPVKSQSKPKQKNLFNINP